MFRSQNYPLFFHVKNSPTTKRITSSWYIEIRDKSENYNYGRRDINSGHNNICISSLTKREKEFKCLNETRKEYKLKSYRPLFLCLSLKFKSRQHAKKYVIRIVFVLAQSTKKIATF